MSLDRAVMEAFGRVLELPPHERERELAALDVESPGLGRRVRELLAAAARNSGDGFLDRPVIDAGAEVREALAGGREVSSDEGELPRETFGLLEPVRRLGVGESCTVYLCERCAVDRGPVAVKVLNGTEDRGDASRRFGAERETVAKMRHRNIASFFESGVSSLGRLYFAMEFVDGATITRFCEERGLGIRGRLGLFLQVCEGVSHAHQLGIIHRDLKPSNILVESRRDQPPLVKVIDFGIARALERPHLEGRTSAGLVVGTLGYMSPEQLGGAMSGVGTRSDVYSLGLVLFEVLTGARPFDEQAGLRGLAALRGREALSGLIEPFEKRLGGDLCSVLRRATAAAPADRYESVRALADDLERHLRHLPVEARRGNVAYIGARFVRRHRALIAVGAALMLGGAGAFVSWWRAREAGASLALRVADAWLNEALGMGRELGDPARREPLVRRLLAETEQLGELFPRDERVPRMRCAAQTELGYILLAKGDEPGAMEQFRAALTARERMVTRPDAGFADRLEHSLALVRVGDAAIAMGESARGEEMYARAFEMDKELAARNPNEPRALSNLGWSCERMAGRSGDAAFKERMLTIQVDAFRRLSEMKPGREAWRGLSSAYKALAVIRQASGREFLREAELAVHAAEEALSEAPLDRFGVYAYFRAAVVRAEAQPEVAGRMAAIRDTLDKLAGVVESNPQDRDALELWAYGLERARSICARAEGTAAREAEAELEAAVRRANERLGTLREEGDEKKASGPGGI